MEKREISLLGLLVEVLLRWRVILGWMLSGALLFGVYGYYDSYQEAKKGRAHNAQVEQLFQIESENKDEDVVVGREWLLKQLTDEQIENVQTFCKLEKVYKELWDLNENSIYMKIDADEVPTMEVIFEVNAGKVEKISSLIFVYEDLLQGRELQMRLANKLDTSEGAINGLVTLLRRTRESDLFNNTVSIRIYGDTEDTVEVFEREIVSFLEEKNSMLAENVGEHTIKVLNQAYSAGTNSEILNNQKEMLNEENTLRTTINKQREAFSLAEKNYYILCTTKSTDEELLTQLVKETNSEGLDLSAESVEDMVYVDVKQPKISIKYVMMGMLAMAFLYCAIYAIGYILSTKLHGMDDVKNMYGIPQLGLIPEKRKRQLFYTIDEQILKIKNHGKRVLGREEAEAYAAAAIGISLEKELSLEVCLAGCNLSGETGQVCNKLKDHLQASGVKVDELNNVLYDPKAIQKLQSVKRVVLVETIGETLYDEIAKEVELFERQNIAVLGLVMVE